MKKTCSYCLIFFALLVLSTGCNTGGTSDVLPEVDIEFTGALGMAQNAIEENSEEEKYRIKIEYPKIKGTGYGNLNRSLKARASENASEFKTFIKDFDPFGERVCKGTYTVPYNHNGYASIEQSFEWAVPGTSVIIYKTKALNFNTKSLAPVTFWQLFDENKRTELFTLLTDRLPAECSFPEGEPNTQDFYFSDQEIILFSSLKGSPDCNGRVVAVDWKDLGEYLTDTGKKIAEGK